MLRKSIFHEAVIPCDTLKRVLSFLASVDVTQYIYIWYCLSIVLEKSDFFPKSVTFFILDGCLQPCRLVYVPKV